jgi:adenosylmethionine-8-amino-7-oxononanoate aminotransferase
LPRRRRDAGGGTADAAQGLAEDLPEIAELDLNPVLVTANGVSAVDVKLRLALVGTEPDETLRALREPR